MGGQAHSPFCLSSLMLTRRPRCGEAARMGPSARQGGEDGGDLCCPSLAISLPHALLPTHPPFCTLPALSLSAHLPCLANPFVRMTATHVTTTRIASIPVVRVTATHVTIRIASLLSASLPPTSPVSHPPVSPSPGSSTLPPTASPPCVTTRVVRVTPPHPHGFHCLRPPSPPPPASSLTCPPHPAICPCPSPPWTRPAPTQTRPPHPSMHPDPRLSPGPLSHPACLTRPFCHTSGLPSDVSGPHLITAFSHFVLENVACGYMFADIQGTSVFKCLSPCASCVSRINGSTQCGPNRVCPHTLRPYDPHSTQVSQITRKLLRLRSNFLLHL